MRFRLEPWSVVTGTLVDTNGAPVANEELILGFDGDWFKTGEPHINFNFRGKTGLKGEFTLSHAPPGELILNRVVPFSPTPGGPPQGWQHTIQTRFYAGEGRTNDLGRVTLDTPPPAPLFEQLKKKVGL
jgi:hypothetical protein